MPELDIISLRLPLIVFGLLIIGCVVSSKISSRFSMPGLLVFLLIGMGMHLLLAGTGNADAAGALLSPQVANAIGTVALGIILFSGGMDSSFDDIKRVFKTGTILSTAGVLLTALLVGSFAYLIALGYDRGDLWPQCFLFGSIISSTDASAVFSILRSKRISLKGNLKPLLEYESGSNDPMATFLTLFFLHICLLHSNGESVGAGNLLMMIPEFFYKMGLGVAIGVLVGITVVWLFNHIRLDYDGLYYVLGSPQSRSHTRWPTYAGAPTGSWPHTHAESAWAQGNSSSETHSFALRTRLGGSARSSSSQCLDSWRLPR